ncbi:MAG: hypothetical protein RI983_2110 [Bacteroidota bacterium]|jgi:hypothetical protein
MKKLLIIAALLISGVALKAQTKYGFKLGYNLGSVSSNDPEIKEDGKTLSGIGFGAFAEFSVGKNFTIQPQLNYNRKGLAVAHDGHSDKFQFNVLDIPVNALYRSNGGFFIGGGPNFGFNLSGGLRAHDDPSENFDFEFGKNPGQIKRMDLGLNLLTGYEFKNGLFVSANYLAGLTNLSNVSGQTWRNNLLNFSLGYSFGGTNKK